MTESEKLEALSNALLTTTEQLNNFLQSQAQINFRYEILIRAVAEVLGAEKLDAINARAEAIKTELIAQTAAAKAAAETPAAPETTPA
jgi:hypothetical protein